jgi:hypothetical protein
MKLSTVDSNTRKLAVAFSWYLRPEEDHYKRLINTAASSKGSFFSDMVEYLVDHAQDEDSKTLFDVKSINHLGEKISAILEANLDSKLPPFRSCRVGLRKYG